ncbi:MAG: heavy metal translocating P-type ATPase [Desulfohalobiaceae bacterium]|nr:heavy metal translocating P-type ATPase [Desulfohalobiaceae bacterium]
MRQDPIREDKETVFRETETGQWRPGPEDASCTRQDVSCSCGAPSTAGQGYSLSRKIRELAPGVLVYIAACLQWWLAPLPLPLWGTVALFVLAYLLIARDILASTLRNLRSGRIFDEFFLMTLATLGAFAIGAYAEAVAVILFFKVGEMVQESAVDKSRRSITGLLDLRPDRANLERDGEVFQVDPSDVEVGDLIQVKPGERIPLDGEVVRGESNLDTSVLTGESRPVDVAPGSNVFSGSINKSGLLLVRVSKPLASSTMSKILELVENAQAHKAPTEQFISRFAYYYTPAVVLAALLIAVAPWAIHTFVPPLQGLFQQAPLWSESVYNALIFLVISCPCALVISIPLGFFGGIGAASREGILVKGANYLEGLNKLGTVVWDKTGTLTEGVFQVTRVEASNGYSREKLLRSAALAESHSNHPIALSIRRAVPKTGTSPDIGEYTEHSGRGVSAVIEEQSILVGNDAFMREQGIEHSRGGGDDTLIHVGIDGSYAGSILIGDALKDGSVRTVAALHEQGIKQYLLSGDSHGAANAYARRLGIDQALAPLLPQEKVSQLERIKAEAKPGELVAFVGDGINDAPVLARADIGIAMGGLGSDAAIEAADVVLMRDQPEKLLRVRHIARRTRSIVWQNIVLALSIKLLVLGLGTMGLATLWEAVFADVGVALLAVLNSLRVMRGNGASSENSATASTTRTAEQSA